MRKILHCKNLSIPILCSGTRTRPALSAEKDMRKDKEYASGFYLSKRNYTAGPK